MFRYFEEEIRLLEEWMKKDTCSEDYIQFVGLADFEEKLKVPYNSGINEEEMQQSIIEMKYEIKMENFEEDNNESVVEQQWRRHIKFLSICCKMYVEAEWDKIYDNLMQEKIQPEMDELDIEINELWELMKTNPKRRYGEGSKQSTITSS